MKTHFRSILFAITVGFWGPVRAAETPPVEAGPPDVVLGDFSKSILGGLDSAPGMAFEPESGKVFISDGYRSVLRFSSQAQVTNGALPEATFNVFTSVSLGAQTPLGVSCDQAGHLWVVSGNRVVRFDNALNGSGATEPDGILGQPDFTTNAAGAGETGLSNPISVALDSSGCLWVADMNNHRVVGYLAAATKSNGAAADRLLGQPNWSNSGSGVSPTRMTGPAGLATDDAGRLWVTDNATRVLRFDNAAGKEIGAPADGVLGHSDFFGGLPQDTTARFLSKGLAADPEGRLYVADNLTRVLRFEKAAEKPVGAPPDGSFSFPAPYGNPRPSLNYGNGLGAGPDSRLWVFQKSTKEGVDRAVWLRVEDAAAAVGVAMPDGVLGEVSVAPVTAATLYKPQSVALDNGSGKLFVADYANHRILRYRSTEQLDSGAAAEAVFGQTDFESNTFGTGPSQLFAPRACVLDGAGNLWVSDTGNHRVLRFANAVNSPTGTPAVVALGQPDLTANSELPLSEYSLAVPGPLAIGPDGELWVGELSPQAARVVRFDNAASAPTGAAASGVLGRVDFYDKQTPAISTSTTFVSVDSMFCDSARRLWVISRSGPNSFYNDVYRFEAASEKANGAPAEGASKIHFPLVSGIGEFPYSVRRVFPSGFIDAAGALVVGFDYEGEQSSYGSGSGFCVVRIPSPEALPELVESSSYAGEAWSFPNYGVNPLRTAIAPDGPDAIWFPDGVASVSRLRLQPASAGSPLPAAGVPWLEESADGIQFNLRFPSIPGRDYTLRSSADLGGWLDGPRLSALGPTSTFVIPPAPEKQFYQIRLEP